jgi:hypothetical protein
MHLYYFTRFSQFVSGIHGYKYQQGGSFREGVGNRSKRWRKEFFGYKASKSKRTGRHSARR